MQQFRLLLNNTINKICNSTYFDLIIVAIVALDISLRAININHISPDLRDYISPWFNVIKELGFTVSFSEPSWDYSFLYPYILYIKSLFFDEFNIITIKLISISFDCLMAFYAYRILKIIVDKKVALFFIALFLAIPTQWLNSTLWGQIESMLCSFFLMSFYYLVNAKYGRALLFFALTTTIKTTFVFFLPFLGIYWLVNRFPFRYFLIIPTVYLVVALPSLLSGLPLDEIFYSFESQTNSERLSRRSYMLAINFFNIHTPLGRIDSSIVRGWLLGSIFITFLLLCLIAISVLQHREFILQKNNKEKTMFWLLTLAITLYLIPLFLPYMHDRYYYFATMTTFLYMILSLSYLNKQIFMSWLPFIVLETSSIMNYFSYLRIRSLEFFGPWKYIMLTPVKYIIVPLLILGLLILYRDFKYLLKNNENIKKDFKKRCK